MSSFWADYLCRAGVDVNALEESRRGSATHRIVAELKRLPDGTFAPRGQGSVLKRGDSRTIHIPHSDGVGHSKFDLPKPNASDYSTPDIPKAVTLDKLPVGKGTTLDKIDTGDATQYGASRDGLLPGELHPGERAFFEKEKAARAAEKEAAKVPNQDEALKHLDDMENHVSEMRRLAKKGLEDESFAAEMRAHDSIRAATAAGLDMNGSEFDDWTSGWDDDEDLRDRLYRSFEEGQKEYEMKQKIRESFWRSTLASSGLDLTSPMWSDS